MKFQNKETIKQHADNQKTDHCPWLIGNDGMRKYKCALYTDKVCDGNENGEYYVGPAMPGHPDWEYDDEKAKSNCTFYGITVEQAMKMSEILNQG